MTHDAIALHNRRVLDAMRSTRELSAQAYGLLRRAMLAGEDAYPYYSADGRAYVWSAGKRYTASMYNAHAYAGEVGRFFPIVLWRLDTPGFYYADADGREWATFTSGERIPCAVCGAPITHGYRTPDTLGEPARHVCVAHVAAHNGEYGAPEDAPPEDALDNGEGMGEGIEPDGA